MIRVLAEAELTALNQTVFQISALEPLYLESLLTTGFL